VGLHPIGEVNLIGLICLYPNAIGFVKTGSGRCDLESHHSVRHPALIICAALLLAKYKRIFFWIFSVVTYHLDFEIIFLDNLRIISNTNH
jgi:hypothetical protein